MNLTALANHYGSDKGSAVRFAHRYTSIYDLLFSSFRDQPIRLLELGLAIGGPDTVGGRLDRTVDSPSMRMWADYFPLAELYGFDISDFSHLNVPRFTFLRGDSGSIDDLSTLSKLAPTFDIIMDDASHASYHQLLALKMLWPSVASGGLYIIEDLHWQSPVFEAEMPPTPKTADTLIHCFDNSAYLENPVFTLDELSAMTREVAAFGAFPAFDGTASPPKLIILRKAGEPRRSD